jgi:hypothetical protein
MTVPVGDASGAPGRADSDDVRSGSHGADRAVEVARGICPYLASVDGAWLSADPSRDHRCTAVVPPTPPASDKQRRFCLAAAHVECATFIAARELHGAAPEDASIAPWHFSRSVPVVLDHARSPLALLGRARSLGLGQVGLVGLMIVAFGTVVLARGIAPTGLDAALADARPSAGAVSPATLPVATPTPTPLPSPSPSPSPLPSPSPSPSPSPVTYKVKSGDTLLGIASRFGTTVKALQQANGIDDPSLLRIGQVLTIPADAAG